LDSLIRLLKSDGVDPKIDPKINAEKKPKKTGKGK
jgi:hypothetical protein